MCLIGLAIDPPGPWLLVVAANRDEFHDRPAAPAAYWPDPQAGLLAGRDLQAGGTWLGLRRSDGDTSLRIAALTNIRPGLMCLQAAPPQGAPGVPGVRGVPATPPSRGTLVSSFLAADADPATFMSRLEPQASDFAGFNLLAMKLEGPGAETDAWYLHNQRTTNPARPRRLGSGIHVLSNDRLGVAWPKTRLLQESMTQALDRYRHEPGLASGDSEGTGRVERLGGSLLDALSDRSTAQEADLPDTGLDRARERQLSAPFIVDDHYGTRCSTVLIVGRDGVVTFVERSFGPGGRPLGNVIEQFLLRPRRACDPQSPASVRAGPLARSC